jgi:YfiH family protein
MACELQLEDWPGVVGGFVGKIRRRDGGVFHEAPELRAALAEMGAGGRPLVEAQQVHGSEVAVVGSDARAAAERAGGALCLAGMDGLLTEERGIVLAIYVADCLAIYLHHRARPAVGLAHAGWRGLAAGMAGKFVHRALEAYGGAAGDLQVLLSPCIGPCCYEVGEEVARLFGDVPGAVERSRGKPRVDLRRVAVAQLEGAGLGRQQIEALSECTCCGRERLASYRAEGEGCGRNVALIALSD